MKAWDKEEIRQAVRESYAKAARAESEGCGISLANPCCGALDTSADTIAAGSCCGGPELTAGKMSEAMGYSKEDMASVPEGANMGLGCGNPVAVASLKPGETVVDLGSGGGLDCFLAAKQVGETGRVIGVDMTPEMISKARKNAEKMGTNNVEFRLGEIEHLPIADNCADVIMSNCVINLSPEKPSVFRDAFRVLKPGGRLAISDVLAIAPLPEEVQSNLALVAACVGGAATIEETKEILERAGFQDIKIKPNEESREFIRQWAPTGSESAADYVVSAYIEAFKPT